MSRVYLFITVVSFLIFTSGCAFHSTARNWHELKGPTGRPTYYTATSKVGVKLFVLIPFLGDVDISGVVEDLTEAIAKLKGDNVRIVQGNSENYWYGFPPFTWVITPVVSTVTAEYTPNEETYIKDQKKIQLEKKNSTGLNPLKW